jgi:hypothetical protein
MDNHQFCSAFFFPFLSRKFCGVAKDCGGYPEENLTKFGCKPDI